MKRAVGIILLILLGLYFFSAVVMIHQGDYALKTNALSPQPTLLGPGLHGKVPFFDKITEGCARAMQPESLQANGATETPFLSADTFDKHTIALGYSVLVQVTDPLAFNQAAQGDTDGFFKNLRATLNKILSEKIAEQTLVQSLQASTQQATSNAIIAALNPELRTSGVKILRVYCTAMNIANFERSSWIDQMKTEQENQLAALQKQTAFLSQHLRTQADDKINAVLADGLSRANKIRTAGALEANKVYADAYNKDPAFYEFFQNLQMYKKTLTNKQDVLILSTHTPFFSTLASSNIGLPSKHVIRNESQ